MRILMTGVRHDYLCTRAHHESNENDSSAEAVVRALELAGHEVDVRQVWPGEDLRQYGATIVGIDDPQAFGTKPFLGALWTLAQRRCRGPRPMALFTHWNLRTMMSGLDQVNKHEYKLFSEVLRYDGAEAARPYEALLREELQALSEGDWPLTAINAFTWGDGQRLAADAPFEFFNLLFDPSSLMESRNPAMGGNWLALAAKSRLRGWVVGTHEPVQGWIGSLESKWPVKHYGSPRSGAQLDLPKRDLLREHCAHWGALSPPYKHAGSGYWRARFVHAADALCVMRADPAEVEGLGPAFLQDWSAVEDAPPDDLAQIALEQRDALHGGFEPKDSVVKNFDKAVKYLALSLGDGRRPRYTEPPARNRTLF